jgi:hypothetical protein
VEQSRCLPLSPHLRKETDPDSETLCSLFFLEYWTMDNVQNPVIPSDIHHPSEPFRIYLIRSRLEAGLHGVITQKIVPLIVSPVRISDLEQLHGNLLVCS